MKRAILAVAVTAILSGNAAAGLLGGNDESINNDNRNTNTNLNTNTALGGAGGTGIGVGIAGAASSSTALSNSNAIAAQGQHQGQLQGQGQQQGLYSWNGGAHAGAANVGNTSSQSVTVTDSGKMHYSGKYEVKTPGYAPDIVANPTAPCRIAVGIGASVMGGGGSIVGSVLDEGCDARADATMLMALDRPADAVRRLCLKPELAEVLPECRAPAAAPAVSGGSVQSSPKVASNKVGGGGFSH